MLDITSHATLPVSHPRQVSGQFLTKNKLSAKARARLAAEILDGRAELAKLTVAQVAGLCRVSVSSVGTVRSGKRRKSPDLRLLAIWGRATPQQRREFIQHAGPDNVWTELAAAL